MGKNIKFLLWDSSNKSGKDLFQFRKKAAKFIENDINQNGGIAGCNIEIDLEDIPHSKAGTDEFAMSHYQELIKKNNYLFATSPGTFASINTTKIENVKKVASKNRILFNTTAIPNDFSYIDFNVFDLRSNSLADSNKSFLENMESLKKIVNKEAIYHIANMSPKSPIYAQKDELENHNIFLFSTYQRHLNEDFDSLKNEIKDFLNQSTENDLINFGALQKILKSKIFSLLKNYNENRLITLKASDDLDYRDITNKMLSKEDGNYDIYLSMEAFIDKVSDKKYSLIEKSTLNSTFGQFEVPYLIKYLSDKHELAFNDDKNFISSVKECLNKIDGRQDIYMGISKNIAFSNNQNNIKTSAVINLSPPNKKSSKSPIKTLYKNQHSFIDGTPHISNVVSFNIDVQRITNVSIEESIFSAELFLDVIAPFENPISYIKFNNLSSINSKYETKEIETNNDHGIFSTRYLITANFDFKAIGQNYPFDSQFIYISLSSIKNSLILQPVPEQYLDKEFDIDGWNLIDAKCGINRKKSWVSLSENLFPKPKINEEIRLGWELKRANSMTVFKIGIPMAFLFSLVYYTVYLPSSESTTALGYLTTSFLSSIALYFSTERPQPLSMSTIDVIFAFFYIISGISLLMIIFSEFYPSLYEFFIYPLRVLLPISIFTLSLYIKSRVSSFKFKPSITD
jgi:hypothetical protein